MYTTYLYDDERQIKSIAIEHCFYGIGKDGVVKIECVKEAGEMGYVPWFNIYHNTREYPTFKVNGKYVIVVTYFHDEDISKIIK